MWKVSYNILDFLVIYDIMLIRNINYVYAIILGGRNETIICNWK